MYIVAHLVKDLLGGYLSNVPIPYSVKGWFKLGFGDWARLVPFFAAVGGTAYVTYKVVSKSRQINPDIEKQNIKVGHTFEIEELGEKTSYCRCWRSKKFPYCDGTHYKHNEATGDNVGPVVLKRKAPAPNA